jgi:hypothetical protein
MKTMLDELSILTLDSGAEKKEKEEEPDAGDEPSGNEGTGGGTGNNPL